MQGQKGKRVRGDESVKAEELYAEKEQKDKMLQWHPAFYAGIQIEFLEEAQYLEFENEHMLSSKPMQIDVLIIKKENERQLKKNIGQIFRAYNIVEYKSPEDYLSIDDFFKVYGYTCFYKSDTGKVNEIKAEDLSITFVCHKYPRELMRYLTTILHRNVVEKEEGIYYISDDLFAIQLIVQRRMNAEKNLWLRNLTNELKEQKEIDWLLGEYVKNQESNLYHSVMTVIAKANEKQLTGGDTNMCDEVFEILRPKFEEKANQWAKQMAEEMAGPMAKELAEQLAEKMASQMAEEMAEQNKWELIERFMKAQNISLEKACEIAGITTQTYTKIKERFEKGVLAQA